MQETPARAIILGGGLAGLSAAYHSGFPVFEASEVPGGTAHSVSKSGYVFDIGIHVLQSRDPYFKELLSQLNVELVTHERNGWVYSHGGYSLYPFQVNTSHLPLSLRLRCAIGFLTRRHRATCEDYRDWMLQNFGRGFAETFLIPYAEKFWGVCPEEMDCDWIGERVPSPALIEVIRGMHRDQKTDLGTHKEFQYPTEYGKGFSAIARALASEIAAVNYGMRATSIDPIRKVAYFNEGQHSTAYDCLITTVPLPDFVGLLQEVPEEVHAAADKLRFNSIAIVNLGIDRPRLTDKHWIHFPEQDISFFRISFPSNFCEGLNPEGTTSIQAEVSYDRTSVPERDELVSRVLRDLVRVGVLDSADRVSFSDVIYRKYGYVVYDHFRKSAVNTIHSFLNGLSIYPCGRYGMWEYLWSDQAVLSGKKVAEGVRARASLCKSISGNSELADTAAEPMLSVLVVTWNGWTDLRKCLKMLRLSTFRDYELVIVDNASTDGTVENVERFFPEAKVIANQVNLGHPRAVNQGFRHVRGRYVLLLDQDTESPPEAIGQLVDFLERRPDVSVVAPRTYYSDGAVQESARNLPSAMSGLFGRQSYLTRRFPNNVFSRRYLKREKLSADEPFQVEQVGAACMMLRRCLVDEAGPWDEGYFAYWCDTDWFVRLKKMGKKVFCVPQVGIIHHEKNRRGRRKDPWRIREFHRGAYRLYRKHYTMGIFDPRAIMAFLALNLRAALLILLNHLARSEASEDPQT